MGFIARLEQEIPVREVILFGSYAEGKPQAHSDIDLAVISDWFEGKPAIENLKFLSRIAARHNTLIEALPFTEMKYKKNRSTKPSGPNCSNREKIQNSPLKPEGLCGTMVKY